MPDGFTRSATKTTERVEDVRSISIAMPALSAPPILQRAWIIEMDSESRPLGWPYRPMQHPGRPWRRARSGDRCVAEEFIRPAMLQIKDRTVALPI